MIVLLRVEITALKQSLVHCRDIGGSERLMLFEKIIEQSSPSITLTF
jgi:hypothetical protein